MARLVFLLGLFLIVASCSPPAAPSFPGTATVEVDVPSPRPPVTATTSTAAVEESFDDEPIETAEPKQSDASTGDSGEPAMASVSDRPSVRLDGPTETYSLDDANRTIPAGILREVGFFGGGGGDGPNCNQYQEPTVIDDYSKLVTEWLLNATVVLCGWKPNERVTVQVTSPDGAVAFEQTELAFGSDPPGSWSDGTLYINYTPELNSQAGIYTVRFSGSSGTVEQPVEVVTPDGPHVYFHNGRIVLFQFEPSETIRLYSYEPTSLQDADDGDHWAPAQAYALSTWSEFVTDAEGQLLIEGFPGSAFRIVGGKSGEVRVTPFDAFHTMITSFRDVSILRPRDEEISQVPDIWSLVNFVDHQEPGERTYELSIGALEPLYWRMRWCAADAATLRANLPYISMNFMIDGLSVDSPQLRMSEETHENTGWACFRWATIVTNWPTDRPTTLEIEYELEEDVDDGGQIYPAGVYSQVVTVRATPDARDSSAIPPPDSQGQQLYEPLPAKYVTYAPANPSLAPDNVKSTIRSRSASFTDDGPEAQTGPWIAANSPDSLEPIPSAGPEFWGVLYVDTCDWPDSGDYTVAIDYPSSETRLDTTFSVNASRECSRYLEYLTPPVILGTYSIQFATYENMRQSIELVAPSGPRLYVFHEGNQGSTSLLLHQFAPNESVRLYEYKPDEQAPNMLNLVGWQEFQTDTNGQLHIGTPYCISSICMSDPGAYYPTFVVIGDSSGEVNEFDQFQERPVVEESILASP